MYMNNIINVWLTLKFILFTNDTVVFYRFKTIENIDVVVNQELDKSTEK